MNNYEMKVKSWPKMVMLTQWSVQISYESKSESTVKQELNRKELNAAW